MKMLLNASPDGSFRASFGPTMFRHAATGVFWCLVIGLVTQLRPAPVAAQFPNGENRGGEGRGGDGRGGEGRGNWGGGGGEGRGNWGGGGGNWGGGGGEGRGGWGGGGWGGGRGGFDPRDFYARMDANKNGILEPNEMSDNFKRMAGRMGVEVDKPISIDKLVEQSNQRMQEMRSRGGWGGGGGPGGPGGGPGGPGGGPGGPGGGPGGSGGGPGGPGGGPGGPGGARPGEEGRRDGENKEKSNTSSVPGFGNDKKSNQPQGFGRPAAAGSGETAKKAGEPAKGGEGENNANKRFSEYAQSLLNQHDKDKDGTLKKSDGEWEELKKEHHAADADKNGIITKDELVNYFAGLSGRNEGGSSGGRDRNRSNASSSSGSSGNSSGKKSYRLIPVTERLPKGLPDWFQRNDSDGDGQIMMSEFSASWSEDKVAEFNSFDLDGDGFITAKECIKRSDSGGSRK